MKTKTSGGATTPIFMLIDYSVSQAIAAGVLEARS